MIDVRPRSLLVLAVLLAALLPLGEAAARPPWGSIPWWGDLEHRERRRVEKLAQEKRCYCDCTGPIAACFEQGSRCGRRLARVIIYLVQKGASDEDAGRILEERRASATRKPKVIPREGAPVHGPADAPVVITEFADFECPFCARTTPVLKEVVAASGGRARLVFKHFPLKSHVNSLPAALAAVAAQRAGKFWEMTSLLYSNMDAHGPKDLEAHARALGIQLETFRGLLKDPATMKAVVKDKEAGLRLGVEATPTVYVNGREVRSLGDRFLVLDAVEEELERLGRAPAAR